jgi:hypothetical protein
MGCDIHFYVEKREGDKWVSADKWTPDEYDGRIRVSWRDAFYSDRNYDLFAMLANVRNGYGFAGCDTGDGFKPIALPKGLPEDVSPEVKAESDRWNSDGHSHSFLTLAELEAYDWPGQATKQRGFVNALQFMDYAVKGHPESWCGGVGGRNTRVVTPDEMAALVEKYGRELNAYMTAADSAARRDFPEISADYPDELKGVYTQVEWEESYIVSGQTFVKETMPRLRELAGGDAESVRCVFWFDN